MFKRFVFFILLTPALWCEAAGYTVNVVDQENNPVVDAVVAFPNSSLVEKDDSVVIMDQVDKQFSPRVIAIQKGQRVKFPNSDDIRHHVYSFSPVKPFEIKLYKGSKVAPILFDKPGIGTLGCNIHDDMIGHIYISDGELTSVSNTEGLATFEEEIPAHVVVWHKDLSLDGSLKVNVELDKDNGVAIAKITLVNRTPPPQKRTFGSSRFGG